MHEAGSSLARIVSNALLAINGQRFVRNTSHFKQQTVFVLPGHHIVSLRHKVRSIIDIDRPVNLHYYQCH